MKEDQHTLKTAYSLCPNYDKIIEIALATGVFSLANSIQLTPGIPLRPMLASPTRGIREIMERFTGQDFTCEWKYDGEHCQVHRLANGEVKLYSRGMENNTGKYPDIVKSLPTAVKAGVKEFIADAEVVAWDRDEKCILPFQVLATRKRKNVDEANIKVQVCLFAFDLLSLNGRSLVTETLRERRKALHDTLREEPGTLVFATSIDSDDVDEIGVFMSEAMRNKCEGLMVKTLDVEATYEIAKRSHNWLKLKKDYLASGGDTYDLVVIGGYMGAGKRAGAYGGYLLACYDEQSGNFQSICKIGTGFSEDDLFRQYREFSKMIIPKCRDDYAVDPSLVPDHWFDARVVWEVKAADLSISPRHRAAVGIVEANKGISLRFPRFIRVRRDKKPDDATSAKQVADMYKQQGDAEQKENAFSKKGKAGKKGKPAPNRARKDEDDDEYEDDFIDDKDADEEEVFDDGDDDEDEDKDDDDD